MARGRKKTKAKNAKNAPGSGTSDRATEKLAKAKPKVKNEELLAKLEEIPSSLTGVLSDTKVSQKQDLDIQKSLFIKVVSIASAWLTFVILITAYTFKSEPQFPSTIEVTLSDDAVDFITKLKEHSPAEPVPQELSEDLLNEPKVSNLNETSVSPQTLNEFKRSYLGPSVSSDKNFEIPNIPSDSHRQLMFAHIIDMGQANAALLEFPCGTILIDAGAQDSESINHLIEYLADFFINRPHLNNTIDSIVITHNHIDHTRALKGVVENFTVKRYFDNGQHDGAIGTGTPRWVVRNAQTEGRDILVREINFAEIKSVTNRSGLTDSDIDPIKCENCDPKIVFLTGQLTPEEEPLMSPREFINKNNHSIVIRVDFGEASFLFTGDLEEPSIKIILDYYNGTDALDTDVYHVGHHGSHNATNTNLLKVINPEIAVISVGKWYFGKDSSDLFTTHAYGHPRAVIIDELSKAISKRRATTIKAYVAEAPRNFHQKLVGKKIYATAWDETIIIQSDLDGKFRVSVNN